MSMNIILKGERILTTQSGCKIIDKKQVYRIRQTPTKVTYEILEKPTFEEKLTAYCEWEEKHCKNDETFYSTVYEGDEDMLEFYKTYNDKDYLYEYGYGEDYEPHRDLRLNYVDKIIMKGEEDFDKLLEDEYFTDDIMCLVALKPRPVREVLDVIIQDMREKEYKLKWSMD